MAAFAEVAAGVFQIDVCYPSPQTTCCYLIRGSESAAVIDCGGRRGEEAILQTLAALGCAPAQVRWLVLSHPHLDHAGCAGALMRHLPNATVAAHASTIKHLSNPENTLLPAVRTLYGMQFFTEHYGDVVPLPADRTQVVGDGDVLRLDGDGSEDGRALEIVYTPGHAWSHLSVYDATASIMICGDTFGVSYRALDTRKGSVVLPVTPPSQFDPDALAASVATIARYRPHRIGVSHFGTLAFTDALVAMFQTALRDWVAYARSIYAQTPDQFKEKMTAYMLDWVATQATPLGCDAQAVRDLHKRDIALSVLGFAHWLQKSA